MKLNFSVVSNIIISRSFNILLKLFDLVESHPFCTTLHLQLSFYRPLCYNCRAHCPLLQSHTSWRTFLFCGIIIKMWDNTLLILSVYLLLLLFLLVVPETILLYDRMPQGQSEANRKAEKVSKVKNCPVQGDAAFLRTSCPFT